MLTSYDYVYFTQENNQNSLVIGKICTVAIRESSEAKEFMPLLRIYAVAVNNS